MRPLSPVRFNALAGYARLPGTTDFSEEVAWFEHGSERVLGIVVKDLTDSDFAGVIMARDRKGRFRAVDLTSFERTQRHAKVLLRREMERLAMAPVEEYYQGDEKGSPLNFFAPLADRARLDPNFLRLMEDGVMSPARGIIEPMIGGWPRGLIEGRRADRSDQQGHANPRQQVWELVHSIT